MKLDTIKNQKVKLENNSGQRVLQNRDIISDSESGRQVQRYIRLTYLIEDLLNWCDDNVLPFLSGVELSYLSQEEQKIVYEFFINKKERISEAMAKKIREISSDNLTVEKLKEHFNENKPKPINKITIKYNKIKKIVNNNLTEQELEKLIIELLTEHYNKEGGQI